MALNIAAHDALEGALIDDVLGKPLGRMVSRWGVVGDLRTYPSPQGLPQLSVVRAAAGTDSSGGGTTLTGAGRAWDNLPNALWSAIGEALERYSAVDHLGEQRVWAKWDELPSAITVANIPRCSDTEYDHPQCPLRRIACDEAIRWVEGIDLASQRATWVPAVMACYRLRRVRPAERFWYQISTGYAVYSDPTEATVRGLLEVIERDAVALTWLQKLPLPSVGWEAHSAVVRHLLDWSTGHFLETHLFDATTDLGVPTVYCLQRAPHDPQLQHVVSAASDRGMAQAAEKALFECITLRETLLHSPAVPDDVAQFREISDGARYMGASDRAAGFSFLLNAKRCASRHAGHTDIPSDPKVALDHLLRVLSEKGMTPVVVDRTSDELRQTGMTAVCVIVPQLQPMSLLPLAQYKGHGRLYEAPRRMGYPPLGEVDLNPWPQPFA